MKIRRLIEFAVAIGLAFVLAPLTPSSLQAQACTCGCVEIEPEEPWVAHTCHPYTPWIGQTGDPHEEEISGTCEGHGHYDCEWRIPESELQVFATEVDRASPSGIRGLIDSMGGRAYFNVHRGSVQVKGCGDRIIANIPLSSVLIEGLAVDDD